MSCRNWKKVISKHHYIDWSNFLSIVWHGLQPTLLCIITMSIPRGVGACRRGLLVHSCTIATCQACCWRRGSRACHYNITKRRALETCNPSVFWITKLACIILHCVQKNCHLFCFFYRITLLSVDRFLYFGCTAESWGNVTPEGCKFVHLTWNMSPHYRVKCRTSIHWLFVTGILLRNFLFKQLRCEIKISKFRHKYSREIRLETQLPELRCE